MARLPDGATLCFDTPDSYALVFTMKTARTVHSLPGCATSWTNGCESRKPGECWIYRGCPKAPVDDITLKDCEFNQVTQPSVVKHTRSVGLENVRVNGGLVKSLG